MTLSQGSFLLSVGGELDFVSSSSAKNHQGITIKLLKVDLDYTINERYRFFVPKIEETAMRCYQKKIAGTLSNLASLWSAKVYTKSVNKTK